jgi:hypothetical protein
VIGINVSATNLSVAGDITTGNISLITDTTGNTKITTTNFNFWLSQSATGFTTINGNGIWLNSAVNVPALKLNSAGNATFDQGDVTITNTANITTLNTSNISCINLSCSELTTSDAVGSTSIISGLKINKLNSTVARIQASDDQPLLSYNTNTGICAYQGENQVEFRVNGNPLLTCKSAGVRLGDNNTPTEMLDVSGNALISGELTASTIKHSDDFCRFYKSNNTELTSAQTSYLNVFESTSLSSTKVTKTTNSRFTINKAGYYKIYSNMIYENTTYSERVVYRAQILLNGNIDIRQYGDSFVYTRHSSFGELGSAPVSTLLNLSVNDYIEVYVTLKKASGGFGTTMNGCRVRLASDIYFEYLGV